MLQPPPAQAAWRHRDSRTGFEVMYAEAVGGGHRFTGGSSLVVDGAAHVVRYVIDLAPDWTTRTARVSSRGVAGERALLIEADGQGHWQLDGVAAPALDGCLDVDLEASAMTNAFPVHRLGLEPGDSASAPAAWVRTDGPVERLEQVYERLPDEAGGRQYAYAAPAFDFTSRLRYDRSGFVLDYPGIGVREL
jgi:hypothetical protein